MKWWYLSLAVVNAGGCALNTLAYFEAGKMLNFIFIPVGAFVAGIMLVCFVDDLINAY